MPVIRQFSNQVSPKLTIPIGPLNIDWSHPLSAGLMACYLPGISGVDISSQAPTLAPETSGYKRGVTSEGPSLLSDAVATQGMASIVSAPFTTWTTLSIYWRGFSVGASSNNSNLVGITFDNLCGAPFLLAGLELGATGWTTVTATGANTGTGVFDNSGNFGKKFSCCGTFNTAALQKLYVNGNFISSATYGAAYTSTATSSICIMTETACGPHNLNSHCNIVYFWNRELSAAEVLNLEFDPYCLLLPEDSELQLINIPDFILNSMRMIMM